MLAAVLALCGLLAVLAVAVGVVAVRWSRTAVRQRVVVNLGDEAVEGVLWARRGRLLILRDARALVPGREPTVMDGDVLIDRGRVQWVQAL